MQCSNEVTFEISQLTTHLHQLSHDNERNSSHVNVGYVSDKIQHISNQWMSSLLCFGSSELFHLYQSSTAH